MKMEIRNLFSDLEVVKEKIEDLKTAHVWFDEEYFKYASSNPLTKNKFWNMVISTENTLFTTLNI